MKKVKRYLRLWYRAYRYRYKIEKYELEWMRQHIQPNITAIDIGAHKGAYTYWMVHWVGNSGKVVAFEPQKKLAKSLKSIKKLQHWDHLIIEAKGVSNENGIKNFSHPVNSSSPGANFENHTDGSEWKTEPLEVISLDAYFEGKDIPPIGFIKIDVEGHELKVFQGARGILEKYKPPLLFECESRHLDDITVQDIFAYLAQFGYKGQFFIQNKLEPIVNFDEKIHQQYGSLNYVYNFAFQANSES